MGIEKSALKLVPPVEGAFAKATEKRSARVVAVTSGKGGVGKTNVAANLGIALARQGKKVCVLDADLGMANINILLGLYPEYTIEDLFSKNRDIEELITRGPEGMDIIPGASSLGRMSGITEKRHLTLVRAAEKL
ncbi:MAG: P-loop NTPase, partial [Nitrospinota bacterium]